MALTYTGPFESARAIVRLAEQADLSALMSVNGDEQVTRFLPYEAWKSPADAEAWFARMTDLQTKGLALQFVVAARSSGAAIGTCLIFQYDEPSRRAALGYVLGRAYWRQGYMREVLTALIGHGFTAMGLRRLEAEVVPRNTASIELLRELGFQREGFLRQRYVQKGQTVDSEFYGLLNHEWTPPAASRPVETANGT
jgi:[ribosomal protein S5]-alanine N-acetyltransferase